MSRVATITVLLLLVFGALPAMARACHGMRLNTTWAQPAHRVSHCGGNMSLRVFVNGQELFIADLSDHGNTATFYGQGSVVRLHEAGRNVYARAITVLASARVVVRFHTL